MKPNKIFYVVLYSFLLFVVSITSTIAKDNTSSGNDLETPKVFINSIKYLPDKDIAPADAVANISYDQAGDLIVQLDGNSVYSHNVQSPGTMDVPIHIPTPGEHTITALNHFVNGTGTDSKNVDINGPPAQENEITSLNDSYSTKNSVQAGALYLTVSPTSLTPTYSAGSSTITVSSNTTWTVTEGISWASVSATSGSGSGSFTLSYTANSSTSSRSGTVVVSGSGLVCTITVTQAAGAFIITSSAGTGGSISPSGSTTVSYGGSQAYTITPSTGYAISSVTVDGSSVGAVSSYTFSSVTATHTISASFIKTYTITSSAGTGGSISPSGTTTVKSGGSQAYTITPSTGYYIANVNVDEASVGAVSSYTFSNVTSTHTIAAYFSLYSYTISTSSSPSAGGTTSGGGSKTYGSSVTVSATANTGYTFTNWTESGTVVSTSSSYTFTCTGAKTLVANFTLKTYTITSSAGTGGSISPSGSTTVSYGGSQTYTITPSTGYNISSVTVDGTSQGAISSYTFSSVTAAHTISATFTLKTYTITSSAGTGGSISPSGSTTVSYGGSQAYTITPSTGYEISNVEIDGLSEGVLTSITFSNVTASHIISATFSLKTYTITSSAGTGGTINPSGSTTVSYGGSQKYTITPSTGYNISSVTVDGTSQGAISSYTFSSVTAAHTISATFALKTYTIISSAGTGGSISPSGSTTVSYGGSQTYTITPSSGYEITDVVIDGTSEGAMESVTFSNITANHTISVTFNEITYTITSSAGTGGSISPSGTITLNPGGSQIYTITPSSGYMIYYVTVDGTSRGAISSYTFSSVSSDHTINAYFIRTLTIAASAGTGGSINPSGSILLPFGGDQDFTITPNTGNSISNVLVDGISVGTVSSFSFVGISSDRTISASFSTTITSSAGTGGSISPSGTSTVVCGDSAVYTIAPSTNYMISDVLVDGVSVGAVSSYTFSNVAAPHTISASFNVIMYTISGYVKDQDNVGISGATISLPDNIDDNLTTTTNSSGYYSIGVPSGWYGNVSVSKTGYAFTPSQTSYSYVTSNTTYNFTGAYQYTITSSVVGTGGSISPSGSTTVSCSDSARYTITPYSGFNISDVLVDGVSVGAVSPYTFYNVRTNHTISASFVIKTFIITSSAGVGGTIDPDGNTAVNYRGEKTYTITPLSGYAILDVLVDGVSVGAVSSYTFSSVTAAHTISASFSTTITSSAGTGGSISPSGTSTVVCGDSAVYTITPSTNYMISDVLVDGSSVGAVSSYTFSNVAAPHTISATFTLKTYTITSSAETGGSISPSGSTTVSYGGSQQYTIIPNTCYYISNVIIDDVSQGAISTYSFSNITSNHSIVAYFNLSTPGTPVLSSPSNGSKGLSINPALSWNTLSCAESYTLQVSTSSTFSTILVDTTITGLSYGLSDLQYNMILPLKLQQKVKQPFC